MYIVVTGAAGFIGSNLLKALNARGETDIAADDRRTATSSATSPIATSPTTSTGRVSASDRQW